MASRDARTPTALADRLAPDALTRTARDFGLERHVPPGKTAVERAAAMIGQHRILASPLAMAVFRGDLALAVLVENGRSGGSVAAPIAATFFQALDAGG